MKTVIHKSNSRGYANHGWLQATHSFSFANYYDNEKIHFGKLRVLNDDSIAPGKGFDLHPHQDMEIITIPLSGSVRHGDNMGNEEIISPGEVQVMSAGTGIWHSEFNASENDYLKLFQIWIFPNEKGHRPRYDQKAFSQEERTDKWQLMVSPNKNGENLWINQDAFISTIETKTLDSVEYKLHKPGNGVYFMLIDGEMKISDNILETRDALGCWNISDPIQIAAVKPSKILAIEVPMN